MLSLAQCPYCNKPDTTVSYINAHFRVTCTQCQASGPSDISKLAAVRRWNYLANELRRSREWYARDFTAKLTEVATKLTS